MDQSKRAEISHANQLRPEAELLLCCVRTGMGFETADRPEELIRAGTDWELLLRLANEHGVAPLVYECFKQIRAGVVPPSVLEETRTRSLNNARRNLVLTRELLKLLDLFGQHNIPVLPFKGPVLAQAVYRSVALRCFSDLDILVREQDLPRAAEVLTSAGYKLMSRMVWAQKEKRVQSNQELAFVGTDGTVHVDLHWGFAPSYYPFTLDPESSWEGPRPVNLGGSNVLTLSPEILLLYLCLHGCKHLWERLAWICDVAKLVSLEPELDWNYLLRCADGQGCGLVLIVGLCLARDLFEVALPQEITQRLDVNRSANDLVRYIRERLFLGGPSPPPSLETCRFIMRLTPTLPGKIQLCAGSLLVPTEADWSTFRLPASLFPLYYPLRLGRLALKYGLRSLKAIKRPSAQQRKVLRWLWGVTVLVVVIGSLLPASAAPLRMLNQLHANDKVLHFLAYSALALLPALHENWRKMALLAPLMILTGVLLEFGQLYSPGRAFEVADMVANACGVFCGLALGLRLRF